MASFQLSFPPAAHSVSEWEVVGGQEEGRALPLGPHKGDRSSPSAQWELAHSELSGVSVKADWSGWAEGGIWETGGWGDVRVSGGQERPFGNTLAQKSRLEAT